MERTKAVFNWSGGKDSAHALWHAIESQHYEIVALLTTVNHDTRRSTMHGIPFPLLQAQAASIGIPLHAVDLTPKGDMEDYQTAMSQAVAHFKAQGVTHFIFGDIFLHDVRKYREQQLAPHGIEVVEPLWGRSSETVMHDFLASGLQTVVVTTMADGLGAAAIGRTIDSDFIASLQHWHALGNQQRCEQRALQTFSAGCYCRIMTIAFSAAVPRQIVIVPVTVVFAVQFVVLALITDQVSQRKPIVQGDEVDAGLWGTSLVTEYLAGARNSLRQAVDAAATGQPESPDIVTEAVIFLAPAGGEPPQSIAVGT